MLRIILIISALATQNVTACECTKTSLKEDFSNYEHVFAVTIMQVNYSEPNSGEYGHQRAEFRVREEFKGSSKEFNEIQSDVNFNPFVEEAGVRSSCDTNGLLAGATYVIFANSNQELWHTLCGGNVRWPLYGVEELRKLSREK